VATAEELDDLKQHSKTPPARRTSLFGHRQNGGRQTSEDK
jgi:hypothetical protein